MSANEMSNKFEKFILSLPRYKNSNPDVLFRKFTIENTDIDERKWVGRYIDDTMDYMAKAYYAGTKENDNWISIDDSLPNEDDSVLVLQDGNDVCDRLIVQAAMFEGQFYADHMDGLIDYDDRLTVKYWMPIPFYQTSHP